MRFEAAAAGSPCFVSYPVVIVRTLYNLLATGSTLTTQHGEATSLRGHDVHHQRTGEMGRAVSGNGVSRSQVERQWGRQHRIGLTACSGQWLIWPAVDPKRSHSRYDGRHGSGTQRESKEAPLMSGHSCQRQWGHPNVSRGSGTGAGVP